MHSGNRAEEKMSREAIEEAIEVLEDASAEMLTETGNENYYGEAITILRQALETEQAMKDAIVGGTGVMLDGKRIDPATIYKEEPVAWANSFDLQNFDMKVRTGPDLHHTVPLYTAPTKREWVGLTADEIWKCNKAKSGSAVEFHICYEHQNVEDFAEAIEAKLKEKNQ
jgi:predicted metal-dependent hydrolase